MLKHAFLLSVHTNLEQLKLLINTLDYGDIFIHVDKKSDSLFEELKTLYQNDERISLVLNRKFVNWSGFSQVEATLELFDLVKKSGHTYDYIHFISGQDLPLMNHETMDAYIVSTGNHKQFLEVNDIGSYKWRLNCYSLFRENPKNRKLFYRILDNGFRMIQKPFIHRKNFNGFELYKGSQWFSMTYDCMEYVLDYVRKNDYINRFKYTACSDEHFFQILLMNSKFREDVLCKNSRYIVFEGYNASPKTLTLEDYPEFMNGKYMFARKFDTDISGEVIAEVIKHIQEVK